MKKKLEMSFSSHAGEWQNSANIIFSTEGENGVSSAVFVVYFQLLQLREAGATGPFRCLKANSPLPSYSAGSPGSFPARLDSRSGEKECVKGEFTHRDFSFAPRAV